MRKSLNHGLRFPSSQTRQFVGWRSSFPMPSGEYVQQVMPPKNQNSGTLQRIAPCFCVDLIGHPEMSALA